MDACKNCKKKIYNVDITRPKPVGHGYVFGMAGGTIGEWLKLVQFFVRGRTVGLAGWGRKNKYCRPQ